jgi:parvulin-like peptidyl-prolyl isomerase
MEEKLDFTLPRSKEKKSRFHLFLVLLLLTLIVLGFANLVLPWSAKTPGNKAALMLSADETKELATKLAERSLYDRAAAVWKEYIESGQLKPEEKAKALFQTGVLLEKNQSYSEAIEYFYRSEATMKLKELQEQIDSHIRDCFGQMGKFSAMRYELMGRTDIDSTKDKGGEVVAEIGPEKITAGELDSLIEGTIDNQLSTVKAFMTSEQIAEQKKRMLEEYKKPETKEQFLQGWVMQEILYRQGLKEGIDEQADVKKMLRELSRGVLSQYLMNRQISQNVSITQTDLESYYVANKEKYKQPATAKIRHILVDDESTAGELTGRIKGGEDFAGLVKQYSKDEGTKDSGGKIEDDIYKGKDVPGIGDVNGLNEAIFAAEAGKVLEKNFKTQKGWEIIKVDSKEPERLKSFDEVKEQAANELMSKKRQDVQSSYIKQLMEKYDVVIHKLVHSD